MPRGRRILIAVSPTVLADALAGVFSGRGDDVDVIDLREPPPTSSEHYDIAVVTKDLEGIDADLLVELPDAEGGSGPGRVTSTAGSEVVDLRGLDDLLRVVDT